MSVRDGKIELCEKTKVNLMCMSGVKPLCCLKILKIFVISVDGEWMSSYLQPVPTFLQDKLNRKQLSVVDIVILLCRGEFL